MTKPLTQERVRELFDYDPETGVVTRKCDVYSGKGKGYLKIKAGTVVSRPDKDGYIRVQIDAKLTPYTLHRVIFLWMEGYFPEGNVDHVDRNRSNNIWSNLRHVSPQCNSRNTKVFSTNTSGVKGVSRYETSRGEVVWRARIGIKKGYDGEKADNFLGNFTDFTEAVAHRLAAEECLNWAGCDSNSSAFLYMQNYLKDIKCR